MIAIVGHFFCFRRSERTQLPKPTFVVELHFHITSSALVEIVPGKIVSFNVHYR